jgi:hypothetical protein
MKFKEKVKNFVISCMMLLFIYSLCPNHDVPTRYISRMNSFCSMPFYLFILFAFIIIFLVY